MKRGQLRTLLAWLRGEPRVCSMVPLPDEADEDARRCVRERAELVFERTGLVNRIGAVLATLGVSGYNPLRQDRHRRLGELRTALGAPLPPHARAKITRMLLRLELLLTRISHSWWRIRDQEGVAGGNDRRRALRGRVALDEPALGRAEGGRGPGDALLWRSAQKAWARCM